MRLLVCGDRNWTNKELIAAKVETLQKTIGQEVLEIIHGAASGADSLAGEIGAEQGMRLHVFPAQWNVYGKKAGPVRNQQMLDEGKPDMVYAFHNNLEISKGTRDMVFRARRHNVPVVVFRESD